MSTSVFQSNFLRATLNTPKNNDFGYLLCTFDNLRFNRDGFPDMPRHQKFTDNGISTLTIHTSSNDWFLSEDTRDFNKAMSSLSQQYNFRAAMCFSMGAAAALMFSKPLNLQRIMAFSPSIPEFKEGKKDKWSRGYKKDIPNFEQVKSSWKNGKKGVHGTLCFDPTIEKDAYRIKKIHAIYPNLIPLPVPNSGHPCSKVITENLGFKTITDLVIKKQFRKAPLEKLFQKAQNRKPVPSPSVI